MDELKIDIRFLEWIEKPSQEMQEHVCEVYPTEVQKWTDRFDASIRLKYSHLFLCAGYEIL